MNVVIVDAHVVHGQGRLIRFDFVEQPDPGETRAKNLEVFQFVRGRIANADAHVQVLALGKSVVAEEAVFPARIRVIAAAMTRKSSIAGFGIWIVTAREDPIGSAAHRPNVSSAGIIGANHHLTIDVRNDERAIWRTIRQIADLDEFVASCGNVEPIERRPIDIGERLLDIGVIEAARAIGFWERERRFGDAEVPERIADAHGSATSAARATASVTARTGAT